jgi:hypothetical protein
MAKAHLKLVTPATVKRTVTPRRLPNGKLRTREHLTEAEVERAESSSVIPCNLMQTSTGVAPWSR